jgi:peptidylprolyl isomerase
MSTAKNGDNVSVHYTGTLNDGTQFDSSHDRGEPISFTIGAGQMIAGFDSAVNGMTAGETKTVVLEPGQAYGDTNPEAIQVVPKSEFPDGFEFIVGGIVEGQYPNGQAFRATITEAADTEATVDFNHPMAGKTLNFEIELVTIGSQASPSIA